MDQWARLRAGLAELHQGAPAAAPAGRVGATLVLLAPTGAEDLEVVYTRRRDDLRQHPGQVAFPGGRVDPGESIEQAALREAAEEVGLDPGTVEVLGRLPAFYIPPSRFWLQAVVARWHAPHPLVAAEDEVAEVLHVRVSQLADRSRWRRVRLSASGWTWAWQLDERHLLWGATAVVTTVLLTLVRPDWHAGTDLAVADVPEARPWERTGADVPRAGPARLPGIPELAIGAIANAEIVERVDIEAAGRAAADAVRLLLPGTRRGHVLVLAGHGDKGAAGRVAAAALSAAGAQVTVVDEDGLGESGAPLPAADVVLDALVGGGLRGPLRGAPLALVHALRGRTAPIVAIDVPTGLDPVAGLVGEALPADVTVAIGAPREGLFHPGLAHFVGDLYLADARSGDLLRLVPDPPA